MHISIAIGLVFIGLAFILYAVFGEVGTRGECQKRTKWLMILGGTISFTGFCGFSQTVFFGFASIAVAVMAAILADKNRYWLK